MEGCLMKILFGKFLILAAALFVMGSEEAQAARYGGYYGCTNFDGGGSMMYYASCADRYMPGQSGTRLHNVFSCTAFTYTYTALSDSSCPVQEM